MPHFVRQNQALQNFIDAYRDWRITAQVLLRVPETPVKGRKADMVGRGEIYNTAASNRTQPDLIS